MVVRQAHPASHVNRQIHPTGAETRAVDPADWKIRSGGGARVALPFVLGGELVTS